LYEVALRPGWYGGSFRSGSVPMNKFFADQVEQLDLALDQLAARDRNFDRFAMMLIDNTMELTLHSHALHHRVRIGVSVTSAPPDPVAKLVASALGPYFEPKLKLARATELLPADAADSVQYLHSLRNTVYHQGLRHEGILRACSLFYCRMACLALRNLKPALWLWSSDTEITHRARKYLGAEPRVEGFAAAWMRLDEVAAAMGSDLIADLTADMRNTIEEADRALSFLSEDSSPPLTRDEAVLDAQVGAFVDPENDWTEYAATRGDGAFTTKDYVRWLAEKYRPTFRKDPIPSWRVRLSNLQAATSPHAALKMYSDFVKQTTEIREQIDQSAAALDRNIDTQVDAAREDESASG
jgi:hypothetical protein